MKDIYKEWKTWLNDFEIGVIIMTFIIIPKFIYNNDVLNNHAWLIYSFHLNMSDYFMLINRLIHNPSINCRQFKQDISSTTEVSIFIYLCSAFSYLIFRALIVIKL